ncbi:hypothetical protein GCM10009775_21050 [Microbacterium aoyamense]|uniref:DUF1211 domain-containing protein n=1 Tax=Microbacterium aoyamense TaxID=344166 RepID=A0ABP5B2Z6_9MICO|nr:TMEM175 family protein [Microbacterium aoyamense]
MTQAPAKRTFFALGRVENYTDAVFAIAATLLVLDLTTTAFGKISSDAELWHQLGAMWPSFMAFGVSSVLLGGLWVSHISQFRDIARADIVLLWLNNARLLFIVLIPFTTSLVSEYSDYYAGRVLLPVNFFFAMALGIATWFWAASKDGHLLKDEAKPDAPSQTVGSVTALIAGGVTVALSPWLGSWAFLTFAVSGPISGVLQKRRKATPSA